MSAIVLVVDDNQTICDLLSRRLARHGYTVHTAANGRAGIALAREVAPDLIILDLQMPVLDGWETTRALRSDPVTRDKPILALTSLDSARERASAADCGFSDFDTKPIALPRLLSKIERLLVDARPD